MEISIVLTISTGHIPKADRKRIFPGSFAESMAANTDALPIYMQSRFAVLLVIDPDPTYRSSDLEGMRENGWSAELIRIFDWAASHNADYLILDRDGPREDALPFFD